MKVTTSILFLRLCQLAFAVLSTLYVFRYFLLSHGDIISGDLGDTRIVIVLLEHWKNFFDGTEAWDSPNFFYPIPRVLGNTDAHALFAPIYIVLRLFYDQYISYEVTLILTRFAGFFFMEMLLRRALKLPHWISILGATLFTILAVNYVNLAHGQFLTVAYIPLLTLLVFRALQASPGGAESWLSSIGAVFLFAALCLSSFYIAWYFMLACVLVFLQLFFWSVFKFGINATSQIVLTWSGQRIKLLCAVLATLACTTAPFFFLYLPSYIEHGGYPLDQIMSLAQRPADILNAGADNWIWGPLLSTRQFSSMTGYFSFTPLLLSFLVVGLFSSGSDFLSEKNDSQHENRLAFLIGSSGVLLWILFLRFDGWTPYWLIYTIVPGGAAMRAPYELTVFLGALFVPAAMVGLNRLVNLTTHHSIAVGCVTLACVFLLAEQRMRYSPGKLSAVDDALLLRKISPVPNGCQSFFVYGFVKYGARPLMEYYFVPTTQAMMIAARDHVPTLNGISTVTPQGWDLMPPLGDNYRRAVQSWRDRYSLKEVCELNLFDLSWNTAPFDKE